MLLLREVTRIISKVKIPPILFMVSYFLLSSTALAASSIPNIKWYTEDYPPFNYQQTGEIKGIAVDILKKAYSELNWSLNTDDISIMPWTRAYYTLKSDANACLFSMTFTKERAKNFNFIGTVMPNTVAIIGHQDSSINEIQLRTDFNLRFGVVKNDIGHQTLMEYGIPGNQFVFLKTGFELVKMLEHKRVDLIAYGDVIARYQFERAKISPNKFKVVKPLLKSLLGYACNKSVPSDVLQTLNTSIEQIVRKHPTIIEY
ncbi:substrate-binding periplasmic protein [Pseudoalteromonas sp. G4]|uniref:substrate-binding periplasmic protein n=1 Tax=Pseudoalteromonas sp. G4 TaxID=2992761 RepID=UPI00237D4FF8|nr:transporter substrate-binding domain-containing protein [Pseudoalteromonas sp. G4]MDE3271867.1 transporter substrate-binding domain-containing protein [Pseudoalteromonas sp. G4]